MTNTCVWCRNIYRDRRATYLHHQHSGKRGYCTGRSSLHTVVIPVNTTCSQCDQHFESVAMLLEHLRTVFPFDRRNAELGLDAGAGNAGGEATDRSALEAHRGSRTQTHRSKCCQFIPSDLGTRFGDPRAAGGHLPHDACEARRTFGAGEQSGHGTLRVQGHWPTGEPPVHGWAAMMTALTTDPALSSEDKQKVAAHTSSANSPQTLLQSIYWSQFKKHFRRTGSSGSVSWTPRLSPSCAPSSTP